MPPPPTFPVCKNFSTLSKDPKIIRILVRVCVSWWKRTREGVGWWGGSVIVKLWDWTLLIRALLWPVDSPRTKPFLMALTVIAMQLKFEASVLDPNPDWIRTQLGRRSVSGLRIRIKNPDPGNNAHKRRKQWRIQEIYLCVDVVGGNSCSLKVFHRCPWKLLLKSYLIFVKFVIFWSSKIWIFSRIRIFQKAGVRIWIQWIRIRNTAFSSLWYINWMAMNEILRSGSLRCNQKIW